MKNPNKRQMIWLVVIIGCFVSVPLRIIQVEKDRGRTIVSFYDEWKKNGKPVIVQPVEAKDVPVYAQFTVKTTDGQVAYGFVTGAVKDALKEGQEVYKDDKTVVYGTLAKVAQEMDIGTGMFPVEVKFSERIEPDRLFVVCCHTGTLKNAVALPNEVLDIDNGEYYVWKNENGLAKKYKVTVGSRNGYGAIITEGLHAGDTVVFSGQSLLQENDRLKEIKR